MGQLVFFILSFKGTQFLSNGIIRTLVGFFQFIACISVPAMEEDHFCEDSGPGLAGHWESSLGGFLLQVLLIWIGFLMLPCSNEHGRSKLGKLHQDVNPDDKKSRGGYICYFMVYDIICTFLCLALLGYVISIQDGSEFVDKYKTWQVKQTFFGIGIIYGYLSLPFFFFT